LADPSGRGRVGAILRLRLFQKPTDQLPCPLRFGRSKFFRDGFPVQELILARSVRHPEKSARLRLDRQASVAAHQHCNRGPVESSPGSTRSRHYRYFRAFPKRGVRFSDEADLVGHWSHTRPSSRRPAFFLLTPPHCLKEKRTLVAWDRTWDSNSLVTARFGRP